MVFNFHSRYLNPFRRGSAIILAFVLCLGFIIGSVIPARSDHISLSLMRTAAHCRVSIVGLFSVLVLPFLFSAFAVYIRQIWLLIPISFLKAFFFGFSCASVLYAYGASGWLVCFLLLFSDCLTLPVLCWFWIRITGLGVVSQVSSLLAAFGILFGIVMIDVQYISPFLVNLLS